MDAVSRISPHGLTGRFGLWERLQARKVAVLKHGHVHLFFDIPQVFG
jgi:hypothetical protein